MVTLNRTLIALAMGLAVRASVKQAAEPHTPLELMPAEPVQAPKKHSFAEQRLRDKQRKMERKWRR